jgi:hypothetical protein
MTLIKPGFANLLDPNEPGTADHLFDLEGQDGLSSAQAEELLDWLRKTEFDANTIWEGELAAGLLRDRATDSCKRRIRQLCDTADGWQLFLCLLALSNDGDWRDLAAAISRAVESPEQIIRSFALELQWRNSNLQADEETRQAKNGPLDAPLPLLEDGRPFLDPSSRTTMPLT